MAVTYTVGDLFANLVAGSNGATSTTHQFQPGDFDHDGDIDLVYWAGGSDAYYRNDGGGSFTHLTSLAGTPFAGLSEAPAYGHTNTILADFDGDGDEDIFYLGDDAYTYLTFNGSAYEVAASPFAGMVAGTTKAEFLAGDFDGDGDIDLVNFDGAQDVYRENLGGGVFGSTTDMSTTPFAGVPAPTYGLESTMVADFDGDGDLDLHFMVSGSHTYLVNNGGSYSQETSPFPALTASSGGLNTWKAGDFDSDGDVDVVFWDGDNDGYYRNDGNGGFTLFNSAIGTPFEGTGAAAPTYGSQGTVIADFDGDGDLDILEFYSSDHVTLAQNGAPPRLVSSTPGDDATGVSTTANMTLTFSETVNAGAGDIRLYRADGLLVESFSANDARVTGSGTATITIDFAATLAGSTGYYLEFDTGAFTDIDGTTFGMLEGNQRVGIDDPTFLNFATVAANAAPTDIALSDSTVGHSEGTNAAVGAFSTTDADPGDTHAYTLVTGTGDDDNSLFTISGSTLQANDPAVLVPGAYSIRVSTTDAAGASYEESFTITVVDNVAPTISSVSGPANATYGVGQNLDFTVNFDEDVNINTAGGTPSIALTVGGATVQSAYLSGSGTTALVFRYTVQPGDQDADGITTGTLQANGGTIRDLAGNDADLTLNGMADTSGVLVDAVDDPAVAIDDAFATDEATPISGDLFAANPTTPDSDDGGQAFAITEVDGSAVAVGLELTLLSSGALLTVNADGTFDYDPNGGFDHLPASGSGASNLTGTDTFTYTVTGGDTATVTITVGGVDTSDLLLGTAAGDTLDGGVGNDIIEGGDGGDSLDGGDGSDTATYVNSAAAVIVNLFTSIHSGGQAAGDTLSGIENLVGSQLADWLNGTVGDNRLEGGDGADFLNGSVGIDALLGQDGDDILLGGADADQIDGGAGSDTASYANSNAAVTVDLGAGTASGDHADGDTFVSIENLTGSDFDDILAGDAGANVLTGGNGDDLLIGGLGADKLHGHQDIDTVDYSGSGTGVSVNLLTTVGSGAGSFAEGDLLTSIENVIGSAFADVVTGTTGANVLTGGDGADGFNGSLGDDQIFGQGGDDVMVGGAGADALDGGDGIDTASYANAAGGVGANVTLAGGVGSDGDAGGDILTNVENIFGTAFFDDLVGDGGSNTLNGWQGDDNLNGGDGDDVLLGGVGDDELQGGAGDDVLSGSTGTDTFIYDSADFGDDIAIGFEDGVDMFDMTAIGLGFADFTETAAGPGTRLTLTADTSHSILILGVGPLLIDAGDFVV